MGSGIEMVNFGTNNFFLFWWDLKLWSLDVNIHYQDSIKLLLWTTVHAWNLMKYLLESMGHLNESDVIKRFKRHWSRGTMLEFLSAALTKNVMFALIKLSYQSYKVEKGGKIFLFREC